MKVLLMALIKESYLFVSNLLHYLYDLRLQYSKIPEAGSGKIVILGNGPSLKNALEGDLEILRKIDCMCVNKFSLSEFYEAIRPKYYIFLDPLFFCSDAELDRLEPQVAKDIRGTSRQIVEKTTWPITIFLPIKEVKNGSNYSRDFSANPNIKLCYYRSRNYFGKSQRFFYRMNAGIVGGMNVLHAGLAVALQMKYKEIAITGADHSWHESIKFSPETNSLYLEDSHFNRVLIRTFSDMKTSMANEMRCLFECFNAYVLINAWAASIGARICNCSGHSFIDTFPFVTLGEFERVAAHQKNVVDVKGN